LTFDEDSLKELASSVKEHGVLQPILVRPARDGRYELVAGEPAGRATKLAGIDHIPALIDDIDDDTALEIAIIENLQREDLSPLDEALMYERMTSEPRLQPAQAGAEAGQGQGLHREPLRLAGAPLEIKQLVSFAQRHALACL